jgi:APA family basic amino acid/polyamine antiporter
MHPSQHPKTGLVRRLGLFDATMIVMGGIIGSGIFMNPHVVAKHVHSAALILAAWLAGGLIALAGAFVYAELADRRPNVGGQYAYLREAVHPLIAFLFGWSLFLVSNCGGMAAVAMTFGRYVIEVTGVQLGEGTLAIASLVFLTLLNCLGVRAGSTFQNIFMVTKIVAVVALVACGFLVREHPSFSLAGTLHEESTFESWTMFGAALVPVLFAYGGWQTANFIAGEIREPRRNLPRGLLLGVGGVIILYLSVNLVGVYALGPDGLAAFPAPASEIMRLALGASGARIMAIGITISTLGFLSQSMMTAPRVYFAMAEDGLFFKSVAWVHPRTHVPVVAILLQGLLAIVLVLSGTYEQILNYVVSNDFIFFGLSATCLFVFRRRANTEEELSTKFRMPGHPVTTATFTAICFLVVINTIYKFPLNTGIGIAIMFTGVPVYYFWRRRRIHQ